MIASYEGIVLALLLLEVHAFVRLGRLVNRLWTIPSRPIAAAAFQSGDLLLFGSNPLLQYALGSPFTHVGLVVVRKDRAAFLLHLHPTTNEVAVAPVEYMVGAVHRSIKIPLSTPKLVALAKRPFHYNFGTWKPLFYRAFKDSLLFPLLLPAITEQKGAFSCAEYVRWVLGHFGIDGGALPEDYSASNPKTLVRWRLGRRLLA